MVSTTARAAETELIETGEQRDALGRRRMPAERRAELLAAFRQSGLTQKAFARRPRIMYAGGRDLRAATEAGYGACGRQRRA